MNETSAALALFACAEEVAHEISSPVLALQMFVDESEHSAPVDTELKEIAQAELMKLRNLLKALRSVPFPTLDTEAVTIRDFLNELLGETAVVTTSGISTSKEISAAAFDLPVDWRTQIAKPLRELTKALASADDYGRYESGDKTAVVADLSDGTVSVRWPFSTITTNTAEETSTQSKEDFWTTEALSVHTAKRLVRAHGHKVALKQTTNELSEVKFCFRLDREVSE